MMNSQVHVAVLNRLIHAHPTAVIDGPVDFEQYAGAKIRVLWLLREAHGTSTVNDPWSLTDFLNSDTSLFQYRNAAATWSTVSKVTHGLVNGSLEWGRWASDWRRLTPSLRKASVVNLKKTGGESRIDSRSFVMEAEKFSPFVDEQIEVLDPHVVIAAGSAAYACGAAGKALEGVKPFCAARAGGRLWISAYHPNQSRITAEEYYCRIRDVVLRKDGLA